jgi:hypothetical protein
MNLPTARTVQRAGTATGTGPPSPEFRLEEGPSIPGLGEEFIRHSSPRVVDYNHYLSVIPDNDVHGLAIPHRYAVQCTRNK